MPRFIEGDIVIHNRWRCEGRVHWVDNNCIEVMWWTTRHPRQLRYSVRTPLVSRKYGRNAKNTRNEQHTDGITGPITFRVGQKVRNNRGLGVEGIITYMPTNSNRMEVRYHFPDTASTSVLSYQEARDDLIIVEEPIFYYVGDYVRHREAQHLGIGVVDISGRYNVRVQFPNDPNSPRHYSRAFIHLVKVDNQEGKNMYAGCPLKTNNTPYGEYNYFSLFNQNLVEKYAAVGKGYVIISLQDTGQFPTRGFPTYTDAMTLMKYLTATYQKPFAVVNIKAISFPPSKTEIREF